jgi:hypothetical protein
MVISGTGSPGIGGFGISVIILGSEAGSENSFHSSNLVAILD